MAKQMVTINVDVKRFNKILNNVKNLYTPKQLKSRFLLRANEHFVNKIQDKITTLGIYDTGTLKKSIKAGVKKVDGSFINLIVYAGVNYAIYHEKGSGIYATGGTKAKKIPWSFKMPNGSWVTTKGIRPRPFFVNTIVENAQSFFNRLGEDLRKLKK